MLKGNMNFNKGELSEIYLKDFSKDVFSLGFIDFWSETEDVLLINCLGLYGEYDGYQIIRISEISQIDTNSCYANVLLKLSKFKEVKNVSFLEEDFQKNDLYAYILKKCQKKGIFCSFTFFDSEENENISGKILSVSNGKFELKFYDFLEGEKSIQKFDIKNIKKMSFDDQENVCLKMLYCNENSMPLNSVGRAPDS